MHKTGAHLLGKLTICIDNVDLFECYCWQNYTTIIKTDLYLSYFDISYVFPEHNDSVQQGLTVIENQTAKAKLFFETQTLNWK